MIRLFLYWVFFSFALAPSYVMSQSPWSLALHKEGVKVYTRNVDGSNFKEFKGEITVQATLSAIVELIDDTDHMVNWVHNCIESKRLQLVSLNEGVNYMALSAPWPVTDRDMVIRYRRAQNRRTFEVRIEMQAEKDFLPEKKSFVRVPSMQGFWLLRPLGDGQVRIIYQVHSETGGFVPASIANAFVVDSPYYTLKAMRQELQKPIYRNARVQGVLEPE